MGRRIAVELNRVCQIGCTWSLLYLYINIHLVLNLFSQVCVLLSLWDSSVPMVNLIMCLYYYKDQRILGVFTLQFTQEHIHESHNYSMLQRFNRGCCTIPSTVFLLVSAWVPYFLFAMYARLRCLILGA